MKPLTRSPLLAILFAFLTVGGFFLLASATVRIQPHLGIPGSAAHVFAVQTCASCHSLPSGGIPDSLRFLETRMGLSQEAWADSARIAARCGSCHAAPDPGQLPTSRWSEAVSYMSQVQFYLQAVPAHGGYQTWAQEHGKENLDVLHYFLHFSKGPEKLLPDPAISGIRFTPATIGAAVDPGAPPRIGNVNVVDLDQNGEPDLLACDFNGKMVTWIYRQGDTWKERPLARSPYPGHTEVADLDNDGNLDIVISVLGTDVPSDKRGGAVALMMGRGDMQFQGKVILTDVGRVADVRPGDFDSDGDADLVVSIFGWLKEGEIGWLEQQDSLSFVYHRVAQETGGVNVIPTDLDGDGALDFVALLAQEHEEVTAFLNDGHGSFMPHVLYKAAFPTFGSSGIDLVDLDQDGDLDVLYTNGDAVDLASSMVRPYHGVQWLENRGGLRFIYHDLLRLYGAYRAVAGDFDGDGDLDVVASSLINDWADPDRMSLVWLENDGKQDFTAHGVAHAPTHLISTDVADLDGDGRLDIVTGSMHFEPPYDRMGRVTLWHNEGAGK